MPAATVGDVAASVGAADRLRWPRSDPDPGLVLDRAVPIDQAGPGAVAFVTASVVERGGLGAIGGGGPTLLVLDATADVDDDQLASAGIAAVLVSDNPRLEFMRIAAAFFTPPPPSGVHPSAVIAPSAVLGDDVAVGPLCTIGEGCTIGAGSRLEAGVHLYHDVTVGRNVQIHAGAVIGADGFGYERNEHGVLEKFPHLGRVEIGDDVDIGANACIDRASLGVTRIGRGAKIDNLVHIGHNVEIGEDAVVIALAMIGGSTRVGRGAWVSPSACVRDNVLVGDDSTVGLGAVVTRDVPAGATVMGAPARDMAEYRELLAMWRSSISSAGPG